MIKTFSLIIFAVIISISITGCLLSSKKVRKGRTPKTEVVKKEVAKVEVVKEEKKIIKEKKIVIDNSCKQEGITAPEWTCTPFADGFYSGIGVVDKSTTGDQTRKSALNKSLRNLAQKIKSQVKDKVENFMIKAGLGNAQTITAVNINVSNKINSIALTNSTDVEIWNSPSGSLYTFVKLPRANVNSVVKASVISSLKSNNILWKQFQSGKHSVSLEIAFPTTSVK